MRPCYFNETDFNNLRLNEKHWTIFDADMEGFKTETSQKHSHWRGRISKQVSNKLLLSVTERSSMLVSSSDGKVKLHEALVVFVLSSRWRSWFKEKGSMNGNSV